MVLMAACLSFESYILPFNRSHYLDIYEFLWDITSIWNSSLLFKKWCWAWNPDLSMQAGALPLSSMPNSHVFFTLSVLCFLSFSCLKNDYFRNWLKNKELFFSCSQQHILLATIKHNMTIHILENMKQCLFKNRTKHQ